MNKYHDLAVTIINLVGGKENINGLTHCITRLRFQLKDENKADDEILKKTDGVVTVMKSGGQYQVVIGSHVASVYEAVMALIGLEGQENNQDVPTVKLSPFNQLIDIISSCFQPFLGIMAAGGMLKGFNALLVFLNVYPNTSGTYLMLNGIGDTVFYFMPIIIGYTSAKKFKLNEFIGMAIGGALVYPTLQLATLSTSEPIRTVFTGTFIESPIYTTVFGLPFIANNYTSSVIPVILIVWFASKVQHLVRRFVPEIIQNFFVPFFVILITIPVGFLAIGPVITVLTNILATGFVWLNDYSPLLMGLTAGFLWQVLVIFGLHWSLIPLSILQIGTLGYGTALVGTFGATFSQTATIGAMYFKLKDPREKALVLPAMISGICGITEPAIYGLSLPKKKPFIFSLIASSIAGAVMTTLGAKLYTMGGLGIFGVMNYINTATGNATGMAVAFIAIGVATVLAFALTFFFWKDETVLAAEVEHSHPIAVREIVMSPVKGKVIPLNQSSDKAFSEGKLGLGAVIQPTEGIVYAPFSGTVMALFPTKHAIGLISQTGLELLIHLGIDTVDLNGEGFTSHLKQGDEFKQGDKLISFDLLNLQAAGYNMEVPIIVTNSPDYLEISVTTHSQVDMTDPLLTALPH